VVFFCLEKIDSWRKIYFGVNKSLLAQPVDKEIMLTVKSNPNTNPNPKTKTFNQTLTVKPMGTRNDNQTLKPITKE
jgi:hypothetical protein